jgi:hypothetical protein
MVSEFVKKLRNHLVLAVILIFSMVSVSQAIGLGGTGFDSAEIQTKFFFYIGPGIAFLVGIIALFFLMYKDPEGQRYGDSVSFSSSGESPSILPKFSIPKMVLLSLIVFSFLGLYITYTNQTFFEVGVTKQQFTPTGSLIYSGALIPASENLGAAFLLALSLYGLRRYSKKNNFSPGVYKTLAIISALVVFALFGIINHLLRYGGSDMAITSVAFFWMIGGAITILTGSFIPFWIMHIANNLFIDVGKYFSSDIIYGATIGAIILLGVLYALLYLRNGKPKGVN